MRVFSRILPAALAIAIASLLFASPLPAQRQALATHVAAARDSKMVGRVPATQQFRLALTLQLHNPDKLQSFLADVNDPKSPNYRHFLSVSDFTERFGPTADDYQKAIAFAKSNGLAVVNTSPNRLVLDVTGTAAQIEQAFNVQMNLYQHPTESRQYYAPNVEPSIAAGVPIQGVNGLNTFMPPRPMGLERQNIRAVTKGEFASGAQITRSNQTGSGPDGFFLGSDMRAAYYGGTALTGAGQAIGLFEFGPYNMSDVQAYFSFISQPLNVPIVNELLDGVDGICGAGCDDGEEVIDIQQSVSMAPGLSAIIVYEGNNDTDMFNQMATDNIAKSLSCSFGFLPADPSSDEPIFQEFAAQGQNLFVASGDGGAYFGNPADCANFSNLSGCIFYPTDDPLITAAGGTDIVTNGPGGSWQSETGWIGSGGGFSTNNLAIPSYQVPVITSTNQGSTTLRNIPDVAAEANTDNFFCANGGCFIGVGGTSLAAPRWAGFLALANEQANGQPIGFFNPTIYSIGQSSNYANDLHDITVGNNFNSGSPTLFSDETGFDLVTGWGSPDGQGLLDALGPAFTGPNFTMSSSPSTLNVTQGSSTTSIISVTPTNGFTGTVNLSVLALGTPAGVIATISPTSINAPGSATLTVTTTGATPGGNFQLVVSGTSGSITQATYVTLALPGFSITPSSTVFLNQKGRANGSATVLPVNGFSGTVTMSITGVPRGVTAAFKPSNKVTKEVEIEFTAAASTATGIFPLTITGTSGEITQTATLNLAVSAATGTAGAGVTVNLSSFYNVNGIYSNGVRFPSNGGLDGGGAAYSANALTPDRVFDGVKYAFGPANEPDGVSGGPAISLPAGNFAVLGMLATGVQGDQFNQAVTVTYTDGSSTVFTQSFSDWFTPSGFPKEESAVVMPHRNIFNGTLDNRIFTLYNYTFQLDPTKTVQSVTLPNDRDVIALAMTLTR
jgi:subtilase family serine protease